jgi:hypothetical protein
MQVYFRDPATGQARGGGTLLWNYLKAITSQTYLRLFCFAVYGEIDSQHSEIYSAFNLSPHEIRPESKLDLSFIMFSDAEMLEYCEKYRSERWQTITPEKMNQIAVMARDRCTGHPGLFTSTVKYMHTMLSKYVGDTLTPEKLLKYCYGSDMMGYLSGLRCVKCVKALNDDEIKFCLKVLQTGGEINLLRDIVNSIELQDRLVKKFVLVQEGNSLVPPCKIITDALLTHFYGKTIPPEITSTSDFEVFMRNVISNLDLYQLKHSKSLGADNTLLERVWQFVFYQSMYQLCGKHAIISPDSGRTYGSSGYVDFVINGDLGWAIELLRDGRDVEKHLERFDAEGIYSPIVEKCTKWLVVDLRALDRKSDKGSSGTVLSYNRPGLMRVIISEDWTEATLEKDGKKEVLKFNY